MVLFIKRQSQEDEMMNTATEMLDRAATAIPGTIEWMEYHARCIRNKKAPEYTEGGDRLANFDNVSKAVGVSPFAVLYTYLFKHLSSIATFCKNPNSLMSEAIEDRIADAINYLFLLYLMVHRRNNNQS